MTFDRFANAARSYRYVLWERWQKLFPPHPPCSPISWQIEPQELTDLVVRWPTNYECDEAHKWVTHILHGFRQYVRVEMALSAQPYQGIVLVEFVWKGRSHQVAIDYSDYQDQVNDACLNQAGVYFKMQYRKEGYGSDKIVPGGYVNLSNDYYKYVARLRSIKDRQAPAFDVYGRFGPSYAQEVRQRALHVLTNQHEFGYEGKMMIVRYSRSLMEAARARICIDLPGNGPFCFRLIDYLGIGACVIAPSHRTVLHVPLEDRKHIVYTRDDFSDLIELCHYYLDHKEARDELVRNSRDFYDRYLHRNQLAAYYLYKALEILR